MFFFTPIAFEAFWSRNEAIGYLKHADRDCSKCRLGNFAYLSLNSTGGVRAWGVKKYKILPGEAP